MRTNPLHEQAVDNHYLLLFREGRWDEGLSLEEARNAMDQAMTWFEGLTRQGKILGGHPLLEGGKTISGKGGQVAVVDGPFVETKESIAGYLMILAEDLDEAVEIAKSSPMLKYGIVTEVRKVAAECPVYDRIKERSEAVVAAV